MDQIGKGLLSIFDRIYIVNLDSRPDRLREISAELARVGLSPDGDQVRRFSAVRPEAADGWPSIGAKGCFMSQLRILREAEADGLDSVLILEDDADFSVTFLTQPEPYLAGLKDPTWTMLHGGLPQMTTTDGRIRARHVPFDEPMLFAHFIGFRKGAIAGAAAYLEAIAARPPGSPEGGPMHVDGAYFWFRRAHPEMVMLTFEPTMAIQRSSASDITPGSRLDRFKWLRGPLSIARRAKRRLFRGLQTSG